MDWKREAIDKLRIYDARKNAITSIPQEIRRLEDEFSGIRSAAADGTPVCGSGSGSGMEDMLLSNIANRDELRRSLRQAKTTVALVERGLAVLNAEERLVLDRFYIHPARGNADRLCEELGIEKASVYRRKESALRRFTIALYGVVEI